MTAVDTSSVPPEGPQDAELEDALPMHGEESPGEPDVVEIEPDIEPGPEAEPEHDPLKRALAESGALADKLKRVEAEFLNETKRIRRQATQEGKYAIEKVVVDLLPVMDALHSARESLGEGEAAQGMRLGLDLVGKQLAAIFDRHGVAEIEALGKPFDPSRHQAMMMVENPAFEPQHVCEVLRPGYELSGRVVRAAEVMVVKAATPEPEAQAAEGPDTDAPVTDAQAETHDDTHGGN